MHMINPKETPEIWSLLEACDQRARANHGQTIKRLGERGGLGPDEAVAILEDRRWHKMNQFDAVLRLAEMRSKPEPANA